VLNLRVKLVSKPNKIDILSKNEVGFEPNLISEMKKIAIS